ncbi:hypothetical protein V2J09_016340 [Rumex salicifolius]
MNTYAFLTATVVVVISVALLPFFNFTNTKFLPEWQRIRDLEVADLVVSNAFIYTADHSLPFADSMAIRHGRILAVGNYSSIRKLERHGTMILNLHGKVVVPGFIDSHVHFISGGLQMGRVQLRDAGSKEEFIGRIKAAVENKSKGSWILGGGWSNDMWGGELPKASWIDDFTHQNPVWLYRVDGHMGLANSMALQMAGITRDTKDPDGGSIVRASNGEPTGLLIDSAMDLISTPEDSVEERREALVRASNYALMNGVTTVIDFGRYFPGSSVEDSWNDFTDVYRWADSSGNMMVRVCLFFPMKTWSRLHDLKQMNSHALSQWIFLGGVKAFFDGSIGSSSALFYEAYFDNPDNYGLQVAVAESLLNMTSWADKHRLQVAVHAIGDRANDVVLDMYKSVADENGPRDRRLRIEHAQHLVHGAAAQFGKHDIVASVQPAHLLYDADSAIKKLGRERAEQGSYLFHSLATGNAMLAFGSDWPVVDMDPLCTVKASVKRIPLSWDTPWIPSECLSLEDGLYALTLSIAIKFCKTFRHTMAAAQACFLDKEIGSLSPGKRADFVVLSTDSWDDFKKEASASVEATYVGGIQAYPSSQ